MGMLTDSLIISGVASVAAGTVHYLAHNAAGDPATFASAGVMEAGLAVGAVTFGGSFLLQYL